MPANGRRDLIRRLKFKGKAISLEAWRNPEGSRSLRLSDFKTVENEGGKVVSLTCRPLYPQEIFLVLIFLETESTPGP